MAHQRTPEELSVTELEQLLRRKKQAQRLARLRAEGRVVDVAGRPAPITHVPTAPPPDESATHRPPTRRRRIANFLLLLVEVTAVLGLVLVLFSLWQTNRALNVELAQAQRAQSQSVALPTPTATPVIDVVVLPGGHQPPVNGRAPQPGEAGEIPAHLLPAINAYAPPPIPTPGPEQARRIQIPAINVDHPIVQGDSWEQLKKGVGQFTGSAPPGASDNLVLSAHNDIYGEIFRDLDKLRPGDEIVVSTARRSYTYVVNDAQIVAPTDVWVLAPTDYGRVTLISCYPYRINTKRIVVFADLVSETRSY
jgi:sortase A